MDLLSDTARPDLERAWVGPAIAYLRQRRGISARALSIQAGFSESYVGKLEKGEVTECSFTGFARLARALGMTPAEVWFLTLMEGIRSDTRESAA